MVRAADCRTADVWKVHMFDMKIKLCLKSVTGPVRAMAESMAPNQPAATASLAEGRAGEREPAVASSATSLLAPGAGGAHDDGAGDGNSCCAPTRRGGGCCRCRWLPLVREHGASLEAALSVCMAFTLCIVPLELAFGQGEYAQQAWPSPASRLLARISSSPHVLPVCGAAIVLLPLGAPSSACSRL